MLSEPHRHRTQPETGMRESALQVTYGQAVCTSLPNMLLSEPRSYCRRKSMNASSCADPASLFCGASAARHLSPLCRAVGEGGAK